MSFSLLVEAFCRGLIAPMRARTRLVRCAPDSLEQYALLRLSSYLASLSQAVIFSLVGCLSSRSALLAPERTL